MKKSKILINCMVLGTISLTPILSFANESSDISQKFEHLIEEGIFFKDIELHKAINEFLGNEDIYIPFNREELESIKELNLEGKNIINLEGIECLTNLENLNLSSNKISDISNLKDLKNLKSLNISNNQIYDISSLSSFKDTFINAENQIIYKSSTFFSKEYDDKVDVKTLTDMDISIFDISNNGKYENGYVYWNNLNKEDEILEYKFNSENDLLKFSGIIKNNLKYSFEGYKNTIDFKFKYVDDWTNENLKIEFTINSSDNSNIDKVILPNEVECKDLEGEFTVENNGVYLFKLLLSNGEEIDKELNISNIDKKSPVISNVEYVNSDDMVNIFFKAVDLESGLNLSKDYEISFLGDNNYKIIVPLETENIRIYDNAGNYSIIDIKLKEDENVNLDKNCNGHAIYASDVYIKLGDSFNPMNVVSVIDCKGNNISNKVKVVKNNVNVNQLGSYEVTYMIEDCNGDKTYKTIVVYVDEIKNNSEIDISVNNNELKGMIENQPYKKDADALKMSENDKKSVLFLLASSIFVGVGFLFKSNKNGF